MASEPMTDTAVNPHCRIGKVYYKVPGGPVTIPAAQTERSPTPKEGDPSRSGWWREHDHYDRNGYCDNPARGY